MFGAVTSSINREVLQMKAHYKSIDSKKEEDKKSNENNENNSNNNSSSDIIPTKRSLGDIPLAADIQTMFQIFDSYVNGKLDSIEFEHEIVGFIVESRTYRVSYYYSH